MNEREARQASRDIGRDYTYKGTMYKKGHPDFNKPPPYDMKAALAEIHLAFACKMSRDMASVRMRLDLISRTTAMRLNNR